ncbi:GPI mannosyltransferase 3 [Fulvia fulva]|uniref:Mannosyltransferase n=1 Tax=Passalora fulva TaxID=5499 RepID=A0A9Q8UVQ4_PASFU|nr:GPI mannosyltransferase 3 [Fulvia fulva]KAK4610648.1 GPI mannosyltransferase 3 [Fulvia fulva]KAK4611390.1 GPI mannosyltransferase 3 [Fulvia fulva]UJO24221.1 GPI mannosyltransferase 3 [Fulvia fulva]WPV21901.1 GPI mannosyltransferase 3 [Fulvia fulva]WPV37089.1 GPI mannosyltransferase 3 [Fulvia fulva]
MAQDGRRQAPLLRTRSNNGELQAIVFAGLLAYRLVNSRYVDTFFQPDEYFQALEPAWRSAFGPDAGAWITWEWKEGLRTSVHPLIFSLVYRVADWACSVFAVTPNTRADVLVAAPGVLQAVFAAILDLFTWRTAARVYGDDHAASPATLILTVISPWQWFCSVRTFSNSLEATLTAAAVHYFPWNWFLEVNKQAKSTSLQPESPSSSDGSAHESVRPPASLHVSLVFAATAFYLRPTNIIIWAAISVAILGSTRNLMKAVTLALCAALNGAAIVIVFALSDFYFYGEWTFPPFRFLYLNLFQSLAIFYGSNRIDYYFTEGLPLLLTTALPFAGIGLWRSVVAGKANPKQNQIERQTRFIFAFAALLTILVLSAIAHKEMRFIYPLLPLLHVLAAKPFASFFAPLPIPKTRLRQVLLAGLLAGNIYIATYVSTTHQRGVVDVVHYLRHRQEAWFEAVSQDDSQGVTESANITVGFLMPCHSTPWRSHFVYPEITAWALTCEPPLNMSPDQRANYLDEADVFYNDPAAWLKYNMGDRNTVATTEGSVTRSSTRNDEGLRKWPHYLVFFEHLEPTIKAFLAGNRYKECRKFFNTHWIDDGRRKGDVIVWCIRR